ncbi:unnamed protein product [Arabidopsis lyrata]|uniref:Predicted protein n=1 Tax=Arabidopsis lyrata subsp. lyrata TaxID=81972 RepID=D7LNG5_ARALL|nr:predicted protein [Arabidopsis lyrata subsp. lyrata]CAH8267435.1 unnamed protein product [Arabidopsis lyrata]
MDIRSNLTSLPINQHHLNTRRKPIHLHRQSPPQQTSSPGYAISSHHPRLYLLPPSNPDLDTGFLSNSTPPSSKKFRSV